MPKIVRTKQHAPFPAEPYRIRSYIGIKRFIDIETLTMADMSVLWWYWLFEISDGRSYGAPSLADLISTLASR